MTRGLQGGLWPSGGLLTAALLTLGGCGSFGLGSVGGSATEASAVDPAVTATASTAPVVDPVTGKETRPIIVDFDPATECPQVQVITGTSSYATYDGPPSPASVRYQISIDNTARECVLLPGNRVQIKIGIEGQALLGEHGTAGPVNAPVRFVVRDREGTVLSSSLLTASATIPPGAAQAGYRLVDSDVTIPISGAKPLRSYDILVGFDDKGAAGTAGPKARRPRPRRAAAG